MNKSFQIVVAVLALLTITLMTLPLMAESDREELFEGKVAVYHQAMKDVMIRQLSDQVRQNPGDSRLMDQLLIHLPLSPLDMFRARMESQVREYVIPQQVVDLHKRWLNLHPEVNLFQPAISAAMTAASITSPVAIMAATISTNRNVAATATPAPANYDGEIQLSVNKNNTNQMVAGANTWNKCDGTNQLQSAFGSTNGGATWNMSCLPPVASYGLSCLAGEIQLGSDPALVWDDVNNAYFNYMLMCCNSACQAGTANPRSSMVVAKSTNSGGSWSAQGVVVNDLASGNTNFDDKQFYRIDNNAGSAFHGRHYTCWDQNNNNKFAYSTNAGASFTVVDLPSPGGANSELGCDIAVKKNGDVYEVFNELTCGTTCTAEATYFIKSTNGGVSWTTPVLIKSHNVYSNFGGSANKIQAANSRGINPFGSIDVDNSGGANDGRIYVSYSDMASAGDMNNSDVYVAYSTDAGATWSSTNMKKINDDGTSTPQFHPRVAVDQSNGNVVVAWEDGRNDTTNKRKIDIYASRSTDGGATWEANSKVTAASSEFTNNTGITYSDENSTDNSGANPNNYGEYMGLDVVGGIAYMAWTDTRPFYPSGTTNTQKENVGFATATFTAPTPDFSLSANPTSLTINQGASGNSTITVTSINSFNSAVSFGASGLPSGVTASFSPTSITPPANGSSPSTLTLTASAGATTGTSTVTVTGTSGATSHTTTISLTVNVVDTTPPTTSLTAPAAGATLSGTATVSANASDNIGVTKVEFYAGATLIGTDTTSPYSIGWDTTTVANGTYNLTSKAYDAANNTGTSSAVSVTVNNVAGPPALTASYNSTYKAPACASGGKSCDTGASIINGRGTMTGGVESNAPNTINASCADGNSGTYHSDESIDRMSVATNDSSAFAGGKAVTASITVWCYSSADSMDLYYTNNVTTPSWTLIGTQTCTASGVKTFTAGYTLPSTGANQAIRATFRYNGSASACGTNSGYDDHDDLVFGVTQAADTTAPTTSVTAPANGATVASTVTVSATASDNVGVTKMEIYIDSVLKTSNTNSTSISYSWDTTTYSNGSHSIVSKAYDAANNVGTSSTVTVTVNNVAGGVSNGGFETGNLTSWTASGVAGAEQVLTGAARTGTYGDRNGLTTPTNGDSNIVQTFTVPSGNTTLSFYYKMTCPDTVTYDWVTATLKNNSTGTTTTILGKTCATNSSWVQVTAAVTAGTSYTLTLTSHDDNYSSDPSYSYFDDVTLQ